MDDAGRLKLWEDYSKNPTKELRENIILEYAPLVKLVAGRLSMYLGYNVEYDDLVSYGIFGLIDAIDKFDALKEVKFETYASLRIRGAILDQIRKMDWIPRTVRKRQRDISNAIKEIELRTGRAATDEEISRELGITNEEYDDWQSQMKVTNVISLDEFTESGGGDVISESSTVSRYELPEEAVEKEELKVVLQEALTQLTEKERQVVLMYYYEDMTLKEISNVLEVSESRVSQLHTKALNKMKGKMGKYMGFLNG
ncbi:MAG TPA: FliA/WhiG family RNA polymerase sigma factor [Lachnospiraceae bacterium]|nr:FliA/WhiG family RNA polymerase sigma factor [Lachnospiraceae bacterium]